MACVSHDGASCRCISRGRESCRVFMCCVSIRRVFRCSVSLRRVCGRLAVAMIFGLFLSLLIFSTRVYACDYNSKTKTFTCDCEDGTSSKYLSKAVYVKADYVTKQGIRRLVKNKKLKTLEVQDFSNFSEDELKKLYLPMAKDNIAVAALLFAYENVDDSVGNSGTYLYRKVLTKFCPSIKTFRSCASAVSAAINGARVSDIESASVAGMVSAFKADDEWHNLGKLPEERMKPGDIILIKRTGGQRNHVQVWLGNDVVRRRFPNSTGNSVSASYDDSYSKARSAAVATFRFTGRYYVIRHRKK